MTDKYLVRRVESPRGIGLSNSAMRQADLGGQSGWSWGIPGVYQALAAPRSYCAVPAKPADDSPHEASLGYWTPLHHLLIYRLGWSRPDEGLRWWYDNGKPTDDPTLAFLSEVWDRDQTLHQYLAWSMKAHSKYHGEASLIYPDRNDSLPLQWERWLAQHTQVRDPAKSTSHQFHTLGDSFHLNDHLLSDDSSPEATITVTSHRRAVLNTDDARNWYATLAALGETLEPLPLQFWYVDVFVKPIGFLGTFRQSRSTGIWFSGRHRIHSAGNP
jgi:hypothetical protein